MRREIAVLCVSREKCAPSICLRYQSAHGKQNDMNVAEASPSATSQSRSRASRAGRWNLACIRRAEPCKTNSRYLPGSIAGYLLMMATINPSCPSPRPPFSGIKSRKSIIPHFQHSVLPDEAASHVNSHLWIQSFLLPRWFTVNGDK